MSETPITKAVAHAASGLAARSTVPFVGELDGVAFVEGTGILFEIAGKHFIVTAAHVAESINKLGLGVPLGDHGADVWRPQGGTIHSARQDAHDVALVHLDGDGELVARIKEHRTFLTVENVLMKRSSRLERYYVHGFPQARARYSDGELWGGLFCLVTGSYRGSTDDLEIPYKPEWHLLLDYEPKMKADVADGSRVSAESLGGISGCAVWAILGDRPDSTIWTPEDNVKVVGVETATSKRGFIRATRWVVVANALKKIDPSLGPMLDAAWRDSD